MSKKQKFKKMNKIIVPVFMGVILATIPFIYLQTKKPEKAIASWFDTKWLYRKGINITAQTPTNESRVINVPIDTKTLIDQGKMKINCEDVRFTDDKGNVLQHQIDESPPKILEVSSTKSEATTNTLTLTHTVPEGENTALVVFYHGMKVQTGNEEFNVNSATFNGANLTKKIQIEQSSTDRNYASALFTKENPEVGTYTIQINLDKSVDSHVIGAYTVSNTEISKLDYNGGTWNSLSGGFGWPSEEVDGILIKSTMVKNLENTRLYAPYNINVFDFYPQNAIAYWEENARNDQEISAISAVKIAENTYDFKETIGNLLNGYNSGEETYLNGIIANLPRKPDTTECNTANLSKKTKFQVLLPQIVKQEKIYMYYGNNLAQNTTTKIDDNKTIPTNKNHTVSKYTTPNINYNFTHNVTQGNNQVLAVTITANEINSGEFSYVKTVTANGRKLYRASREDYFNEDTNVNTFSEIWLLTSPEVGSNNIQVEFASQVNKVILGANLFDNLNQELFPEKSVGVTNYNGSSNIRYKDIFKKYYSIGTSSVVYENPTPSIDLLYKTIQNPTIFSENTGTNTTEDFEVFTFAQNSVNSKQIGEDAGTYKLNFTSTSPTQRGIATALAFIKPINYVEYQAQTTLIEDPEEITQEPVGFWKFDEEINDDPYFTEITSPLSQTCNPKRGVNGETCDSTTAHNNAVLDASIQRVSSDQCISGSCLLFPKKANALRMSAEISNETSLENYAKFNLDEPPMLGDLIPGTYHLNNKGNKNIYLINNTYTSIDAVWNKGTQNPKFASYQNFDMSQGPFAISFWYKYSNLNLSEGSKANIFSRYNSITGSGYGIDIYDTNKVCFRTAISSMNSQNVCSLNGIDDDIWTHIYVEKLSNGGTAIYINGELQEKIESSSITDIYQVPGFFSSTGATNIDDLRFYTIPDETADRTSAIKSIYNSTTAKSENIDFDTTLSNDFTIETWFKPTQESENNEAQIFKKGNIITASVIKDANGLPTTLKTNFKGNIKTYENKIKSSNWHYLSFTAEKDGSDYNIKTYLDAKLLDSYTFTPSGSFVDTDSLLIGGDNGNNFQGFIDEFKIFAYQRTADQIKTDFIKNSTSQGSNISVGAPDKSNLNKGLIGYWKFDGNLNDSSGNKVDLTANGDDTYETGKFGSAKVFSETQSIKTTFSSEKLKVTDEVTVSAWIKPTSLGEGISIILEKNFLRFNDYQILNDLDFVIYLTPDGRINAAFGTLMSSFVETVSNAVTVNKFQQITVVYSGIEKDIRIFVDGELMNISSNGSNIRSTLNTINPIHPKPCCSFGAGADYYRLLEDTEELQFVGFLGLIDDVRLYTRSLNEREVKDLYYYVPEELTTTPQNNLNVALDLKKSLLMHLKFDEAKGNIAHDSSGNGINAQTNGTLWDSDGKINRGLYFEPDEENYLEVPSTEFDNINDNFSVSVWVKPFSTPDQSMTIITNANSTSTPTRGFALKVHPEQVACNTYNAVENESNFSNGTLPVGEWTNITMVYKSPYCQIYINGKQKVESFAVSSMDPSNAPVTIGAFINSEYLQDFAIDDLQFYKKALNEQEVVSVYNSLSSYNVASYRDGFSIDEYADFYWTFNENTSLRAGTNQNFANFDYTDSELILDNANMWSQGRYGTGLSFDGTKKVISEATLFDILDPENVNSTNSIPSISLWLKSNAADNNKKIILNYASEVGTGLTIYTNTNNEICFETNFSGTASVCVENFNVFDNKWHNLVFNPVGNQTLEIFLDGVKVKTTEDSGFFGEFIHTGKMLSLGSRVNGNGTNEFNWKGSLDELLMDRYTLYPDDISYLANRMNPIAHVKFDECKGDVINDSGPFKMNGIMNFTSPSGNCNVQADTAWYLGKNGKINSGLFFNASNEDYAALSDSSSLFNIVDNIWDIKDEDFSISGWFYNDPNYSGAPQVILSKKATIDTTSPGYVLYLDQNNILNFEVADNRNTFTAQGQEAIKEGWNFFTISIFRSIDLYINVHLNNKEYASQILDYYDSYCEEEPNDICLDLDNVANSNPLTLGALVGGGNHYKGIIDELKIYNYDITLTDEEDKANNNGAVRF